MSKSGPKVDEAASYVSWQIWQIGADAAKRANDVRAAEPRALTSDTVTATILAATSAEAFINELGDRLLRVPQSSSDGATWSNLGTFLQELEEHHVATTSKFLLASRLLPGIPHDKGHSLYQDFATLIDVRNAFIHPKVIRGTPKFFDYFRGKKWTYDSLTAGPELQGWMLQLQTPEVAKWACRAAHAMIWNIIERLDNVANSEVSRLYDSMNFQWGKTLNDERVTDKRRKV